MQKAFGYLGRRSMLKAAGAVGFSAAVAAVYTQKPVFGQATRPSSDQLTPEQALQLLMDGNKRFVDEKSIHPRQGKAGIRDVAVDQFPFAAFLSCADSRVPVELLFDQGLGDCFVCRVAGNIATPEEIGSLEFGTLVLGSRILVVLGHERCGAVNAVFGRASLPTTENKIVSLVPYIKPAVDSIMAKEKAAGAPIPNDLEEGIKLNAKNQAEALMKSPILADLVKKNQLKIVPAYYDLDTGTVSLL